MPMRLFFGHSCVELITQLGKLLDQIAYLSCHQTDLTTNCSLTISRGEIFSVVRFVREIYDSPIVQTEDKELFSANTEKE